MYIYLIIFFFFNNFIYNIFYYKFIFFITIIRLKDLLPHHSLISYNRLVIVYFSDGLTITLLFLFFLPEFLKSYSKSSSYSFWLYYLPYFSCKKI